MTFNSVPFLFLFLPLFLLFYYLTPSRLRNITLLLISFFFYAWACPKFLPILLITLGFDFFIAKKLYASKNHYKKWLLALALGTNIALLAYFKYTNFFIKEVNRFLLTDITWKQLLLPLGISFFTFKKVSYLVDIYRGVVKPGSFFDYALYISFFPQLPAGPIARYTELTKTPGLNTFYEGMLRFCVGLFKKVVLADVIAKIVNEIFSLPPTALTTSIALLGAFSYTIQIYLDFSGYTDMAIGIGKMFGYASPENFNLPYISRSVTEFWRRWHMTLSQFFRDYVYIPLGGNRCSKLRNYANLWIVFFLTGFWHGANWTFLLWGLYHGLLLTIEKFFDIKSRKFPVLLQQCITFYLVMVGWVMFRADGLKAGTYFLKAMFGFNINVYNPYLASINPKTLSMLILGCIVSFIDLEKISGRLRINYYYKGVAALILLLFSIIALSASSFSPFIYFKF